MSFKLNTLDLHTSNIRTRNTHVDQKGLACNAHLHHFIDYKKIITHERIDVTVT